MSTIPARRYGVAFSEDISGMSGKEILQAIIDGRLPAPPISGTLNFWLTEAGDGFAAFEGETSERLLNPLGIVHGGWALTLIDSAAGCAGQTLLPPGSRYTTIETKVNFSRAIRVDTGRVRAEATVISGGRQIISVEARISGPDGRVLAHGTSTLLVMNGAQ
jgi:uncharacterized protein (TIGR00369 family)